MGQYYKIVNLDKREYLHPHKLSSGLKLMELANSFPATALPVLLSAGSGRGGGDFGDESPTSVAGRWAGDRVVVIGDYADKGRFVPDGMDVESTLYDQVEEGAFTDISALVVESFRKAKELPNNFQSWA